MAREGQGPARAADGTLGQSAASFFRVARLATPVGVSRAGDLFDRLARRYDRGNRVVSLGQDLRWKRRAVSLLAPRAGGAYLDCGAGTGDLARMARAAAGGAARIVALDASRPMLRAGRLAAGAGISPVVGDAQTIPFGAAAFDGCVSGFLLRNLPDVRRFFAEAARTLKPGGRFVVLEIAYPAGALRRVLFHLHFHLAAPFLGGLATGDWKAYRYLSRSLRSFPPPQRLADLAAQAGLRRVALEQGRWTGLFILVLEKTGTAAGLPEPE